jgi:trimeric autotransporter adhesin
MKQIHVSSACLILLLCSVFGQAQQTVATNTNVVVPPLVNFSGTLTDSNGKPITGTVAVTFSLYSDETGGAALWMETQNVQLDSRGHYTVMLGSTSSTGIPSDIFVAGEAHWLGVQVEGETEQARVLLVSAPYALKAGDAQTLGGLPPSAFVLAAPPSGAATSTAAPSTSAAATASGSSDTTSDVTTSGGTVGAIPIFSTATNIQNSLLTQTAKTAINVAGKLNLPATGTATSSAGKNSQPQTFVASAYDSSTSAAVAETFQWQAQSADNGTSTPSGTLNLLFGSGTSTPVQTGLKVGSTGLITFATGQTFPGTGNGTVTSVGSGAGLSGGPITSSGSLSIAPAGVTNNMLANSSLTVNPGGGMTGGGKISLGGSATLGLESCSANQVLEFISGAWACAAVGTGTITGVTAGTGLSGGGASGSVTLNNTGILSLTQGTGMSITGGQTPTIGINPSVVPQLAANNTFTGTQTINNITAITGTNANGVLQVTNTATSGGNPAIVGTTNSTSSSAVKGFASATTGKTNGVYGANASTSGNGVYGTGANGVAGLSTICCGAGGVFTGFDAPFGSGENGTAGVLATGGAADPDGSTAGDGLDAYGGNGDFADSGSDGGNGVTAVGGGSDPSQTSGVDGLGGSFTGGSSAGYGGDGVDGIAGSGYAGNFTGDVNIGGSLSKAGGSFKIDHPLDPANKYLYHSFVESPDMMNVYNGNVVLDTNGEAVVDFPEWFGVLNRDFRYQLTCIGGFAPLYVAEKINNNHFKIAGGKPGLEVSWQVTGIRQDAWANAHRIPVEEEKEPRLRGYYIHPELYGAPPEKQIEWARHPQMMKKMQQARQAQLQRRQAGGAAEPVASATIPLHK